MPETTYRQDVLDGCKVFLCFIIVLAVGIILFSLELILLILGFFVGLITNHHPRWMRLNLTRGIYNFWRYQ